ncbi:MAG: hypothetical protein KDD40_06110, partial [Bdellovibrionales bacterium]|nr:hypothetical protein [Bdellovibrionales bacterium]
MLVKIISFLIFTMALFYQNCSHKFQAQQRTQGLSISNSNALVPDDIAMTDIIQLTKPGDVLSVDYFLFNFIIQDDFNVKFIECKLDNEEFKPCDSLTSHYVANLSEGKHSFTLRITNLAGKYAQESCKWTVHTQGNIAIISPQEWQVHQRNNKDLGFVRLAGFAPKQMSSLKIEIYTDSGVRIKFIKLNRNELNFIGEVFDKTFSLNKGGWYKLIATALGPNDIVLSSATIQHIGVGEVFVTAGQSNSMWSGENSIASSPTVSFAHFSMGEYTWRKNIDVNPSRGSAWPSFANQLSKELGVPVAVTMLGCGGTALQQWLPASDPEAEAVNNVCESSLPGDLYKRLVNAIQKMGHFRALLWHQGESDTIRKTNSYTYEARFLNIMTAMHEDLSKVFPWFIAKASYF